MEPHGQMGWGMELHHPAPNWLYTASGHEIRKKCPQISTNLDHSVHVNPTEVPEMVTCILCSLNSPIYWTLHPMVWQLEQVWKPCFAGSYKGNPHQNRTWTRVPRLVPHLSLKNPPGLDSWSKLIANEPLPSRCPHCPAGSARASQMWRFLFPPTCKGLTFLRALQLYLSSQAWPLQNAP